MPNTPKYLFQNKNPRRGQYNKHEVHRAEEEEENCTLRFDGHQACIEVGRQWRGHH